MCVCIIIKHWTKTINVPFFVGFPVTDHDFVSATSSPSLYMRGYDYITIRWNTSAEMSKNVAFYILQVQLNTQSLQSPLELPPSIPRYVIVSNITYIIWILTLFKYIIWVLCVDSGVPFNPSSHSRLFINYTVSQNLLFIPKRNFDRRIVNHGLNLGTFWDLTSKNVQQLRKSANEEQCVTLRSSDVYRTSPSRGNCMDSFWATIFSHLTQAPSNFVLQSSAMTLLKWSVEYLSLLWRFHWQISLNCVLILSVNAVICIIYDCEQCKL